MADNAAPAPAFARLNRAHASVFRPSRLTLVVPLERYASSAVPTLTRHIERVTGPGHQPCGLESAR